MVGGGGVVILRELSILVVPCACCWCVLFVQVFKSVGLVESETKTVEKRREKNKEKKERKKKKVSEKPLRECPE